MKVAKIEDHMTDSELDDLIKEHRDSYKIYKRAYLIKMVKNGYTIKKASEIMSVSRKTGERWVKEYNGLCKKFCGMMNFYPPKFV